MFPTSNSVLPTNGFGTWKAEPGECAQALRVALGMYAAAESTLIRSFLRIGSSAGIRLFLTVISDLLCSCLFFRERCLVDVDAGYRHIDCAAVYMNEAELGVVFAEYCGGENPKIPRDQLFITSKVWNTCHSRADVDRALKQTLNDLQLSYLDLYLVHHP